MEPFGKKIAYKNNRKDIAELFSDSMVRKSIDVDVKLLDTYDKLITNIELEILRKARQHNPISLHLLKNHSGYWSSTCPCHSL